ncbi:AraC family transcriptional regulator [Thermosporothrix hazakensis]|jgi:AraC family transcriptional regulator|uniref:AraC family transcriptional regulator n=2 Tax=Thermosporothrix TaxID=768650 RepID=A0A326U650_THEHA|nr:AraC family transcriptional regulator [Thermosporothrix hazakensis]PZW28434.1 AraC family transcriptional regulator [Thermosporothrix hazakensis]BBH86376.1 AraC family transcriptional regulator [Thermosporothrix sp. COM3]GCE45213.1 AraC family transcriptional regulator [Thermosporothrix hazakensis]
MTNFSSQQASKEKLVAPRLLRSSQDLGWEGLAAYAYDEPEEFENQSLFKLSLEPYIPLVMLVGGAMYIEQHLANGSWIGNRLHSEECILMTNEETFNATRWKALSPEPMQTLHLHLSKALLTQIIAEEMEADPAHIQLVGGIGIQDPLLAQIGLTLWRELEQQSPSGKLYAQAAAQLLAVHLLRHYASTSIKIKDTSTHKLTAQQLRRVTNLINECLHQDLSLEALAEQTGFSPSHFSRLFRQTTGKTPHQFVLDQRVKKAQQLLQRTDLPLAHIALESGFANQSHLTRVFQRYLGLTPRTYRLNTRNRACFYYNSQN